MALGKGPGESSRRMKLCRLLLTLLNSSFVLLGLILLILGFFIVHDSTIQQLRPLLNPDVTWKYAHYFSNVEIFSLVLIIIGGLLFTLGFIGCCGTMKGFRSLHISYTAMLGGIVLVEIVLLIIYIFYQHRFRTELIVHLQDSIAVYYVGPSPPDDSISGNSLSLAWDFAQYNLRCCGAINASDYSRTLHWNRADPGGSSIDLRVPYSCCPSTAITDWYSSPSNVTDVLSCATTGVNVHPQGCYDRLLALITVYRNYFIICVTVVGALEMLALLSTIYLLCRKKEYRAL